ncbi:ZIP family metal transporter [Anaerovibrio sp.]|uniref:ZIP family metal transporter n=1 Tax=Anaerovibrio sp. TaxID=1872532 RepID=UPI0025DDC956|nr:ZIP family metal transporter [Anaerovibrio sp.]
MSIEIIQGLLIPFLGTSLGAACVFFMKNQINPMVQRGLLGFAAGIMVAASVWSLLIPAMEQAVLGWGEMLSCVPAVTGFWGGILFLLLLDHFIPHQHMNSDETEGICCNISHSAKLVLAVVLHNIPEGMAVGVVYASWYMGASDITLGAAVALAVGIAIQNFPEGAIISMPLRADGLSKGKAFFYGVLSGAVEPVGAFVTMLFAGIITPVLPFFLSFAAGAMLYVVVEEIIPEMSEGEHSNIGTIMFAIGFSVMMILDTTLG